ncbi:MULTISPECIES: DM13 domain-containing protein [Cyanophyceae]|uniref:DM13 domain-containing protein n=1 Tax=Cyanophyceae TaxID=3028117 RepID=UPI001685EC56|nr:MULTISPECIES: DM13 domain-containing protein [Cyanophyceae]MBD1915176.1 DM13 domain-containing protein [Phormidium sp. FACHB-77]MBD2028436.1 DM13 domain-containing protein [Phormidium sp. FACHB-322]MBD2051858.1 DM13 domain-containing protein [Leptolyngbya sp. FACHB-60]
MQQWRLTIHGAIALTTPLLVLTNALLSSADRALLPAPTTLRPLLAKPPRLNAAVQTLAMVHRAGMMQPRCRIVVENTQLFLEFYAPFNLLEQSPDLTLILTAAPLLADGEGLLLGKTQPLSGKHRYPIPTVNDISQYQSVVIWCAELNAMMDYAP